MCAIPQRESWSAFQHGLSGQERHFAKRDFIKVRLKNIHVLRRLFSVVFNFLVAFLRVVSHKRRGRFYFAPRGEIQIRRGFEQFENCFS
jgi:hypothetical protein